MIEYQIKEEYDGRLPVYVVVDINDESKHIVLQTFDSYEEAEQYISKHLKKLDLS